MKHILKFLGQLILYVLIMLFWYYPYLIWNAEKHEDHNDITEDFGYCYDRFKRKFIKPRNAL
jgi:hypothetical protein